MLFKKYDVYLKKYYSSARKAKRIKNLKNRIEWTQVNNPSSHKTILRIAILKLITSMTTSIWIKLPIEHT